MIDEDAARLQCERAQRRTGRHLQRQERGLGLRSLRWQHRDSWARVRDPPLDDGPRGIRYRGQLIQ
jgi:hypothetical protein